MIVVKSPVGPAEQHDATKGDIKKAEEKEKQVGKIFSLFNVF